MRHDRGCICQQCASSSASDTLLIGVMVIAGVVLAITTASKLVVGIAILMLAAIVARKLRDTARPKDLERAVDPSQPRASARVE